MFTIRKKWRLAKLCTGSAVHTLPKVQFLLVGHINKTHTAGDRLGHVCAGQTRTHTAFRTSHPPVQGICIVWQWETKSWWLTKHGTLGTLQETLLYT